MNNTKTDNLGRPYILTNLYPSKMGGSTLGKTTVKIGNQRYSIIVFAKDGQTRSGKDTTGLVKVTKLNNQNRNRNQGL